jgi:hypothetical protein
MFPQVLWGLLVRGQSLVVMLALKLELLGQVGEFGLALCPFEILIVLRDLNYPFPVSV